MPGDPAGAEWRRGGAGRFANFDVTDEDAANRPTGTKTQMKDQESFDEVHG